MNRLSSWPNVITRVFKDERRVRSESVKDFDIAALKMEKRALAKEPVHLLEVGKGKRMNFPPEPPESNVVLLPAFFFFF